MNEAAEESGNKYLIDRRERAYANEREEATDRLEMAHDQVDAILWRSQQHFKGCQDDIIDAAVNEAE